MIRLVLPAYNEEANVGRAVRALAEALRVLGEEFCITVVDDGSTDATAGVAREALGEHGEVIGYGGNEGVAAAFRAGFRHVLERSAPDDVIVTLESDGTADLTTLPVLLGKIRGGCDVALASCYMPEGSVVGATPYRRLLSRVANLMIAGLFPLKRLRDIHTYSAFYRAYRVQALRAVLARYGDFYVEKGYACVVELLIRLARLDMRIEEVPTALKSNERVGKSKMKIFKTFRGYMRIVARNVFDTR